MPTIAQADWLPGLPRLLLDSAMANWKRIHGFYAVSSEGESVLIARDDRSARFDTPNGWLDLHLRPSIEGHKIRLPSPGVDFWHNSPTDQGRPVTPEEVAEVQANLEAAWKALGGDCTFYDDPDDLRSSFFS